MFLCSFTCLFFFPTCFMLYAVFRIYMLTCLISCLWLRLAQIYMLVCMFCAPMPMSMPSHACMLGFAFSHAFMLYLHAQMYIHMLTVHFHAYMCRSVCLHAQIDVLYMLYVIIYVLGCFTPCLCAQPRPCLSCHVLLQPFCSFYRIFFLCFWPNGQDPIWTLWYLSSSIHQGPHKRVWITPICMSMLACFCALCLCQPLQFQVLPRLMPLAGLWLCGYIRCP